MRVIYVDEAGCTGMSPTAVSPRLRDLTPRPVLPNRHVSVENVRRGLLATDKPSPIARSSHPLLGNEKTGSDNGTGGSIYLSRDGSIYLQRYSTLADPNDRGMLDVVGFDTTAPAVIADFIRE